MKSEQELEIKKEQPCQCVNSFLFPHRVRNCALRATGVLPPVPLGIQPVARDQQPLPTQEPLPESNQEPLLPPEVPPADDQESPTDIVRTPLVEEEETQVNGEHIVETTASLRELSNDNISDPALYAPCAEINARFFDPNDPWDDEYDMLQEADEINTQRLREEYSSEKEDEETETEVENLMTSTLSIPVLAIHPEEKLREKACYAPPEHPPIEILPITLAGSSPTDSSPPPLPEPSPLPPNAVRETTARPRAEQCDCIAYAITKHRKSKCRFNEYSSAVLAVGAVGLTVLGAVLLAESSHTSKNKKK